MINHFDEPCGTGIFSYIGSCARGLYCLRGLCTYVKQNNTGKSDSVHLRSEEREGLKNINWMKNIDDDTYLGAMSIPGTHDTMTATVGSHWNRVTIFGQCHSKALEQQLEMGIRFVDIRLRCYRNKFWLYHGIESIGISFEDTLKTMKSFLTSHPTETIIMSYQQENSPYKCSGSCQDGNCFDNDLFKEEWNAYLPSSMRFSDYTDKYFPQLKSARGKVILVPRRSATLGFAKAHEENTYKSNDKIIVAYKSGDLRSAPISKEYIDLLKDSIHRSMGDHSNFAIPYITYLSANDVKYRAWLTPEHIANRVNPIIKVYLAGLARDATKNYGVVVMDFPPQGLVDEIIKQNPGNLVKTCLYQIKTSP